MTIATLTKKAMEHGFKRGNSCQLMVQNFHSWADFLNLKSIRPHFTPDDPKCLTLEGGKAIKAAYYLAYEDGRRAYRGF